MRVVLQNFERLVQRGKVVPVRASVAAAPGLERCGEACVEAGLVDDDVRFVRHLDERHDDVGSARAGRELRLHKVPSQAIVHRRGPRLVIGHVRLPHGGRVINNKDDMGPAHAVRGREVDCAVVELPGRDLVLACHVGDEDNALVGEPPSLVSCPAGVSWLSYAELDCSLQSTLLDPALFTPLAAVRMREERERRSFAGHSQRA